MKDRIRGKGYWKLNVSVLQEEEYRHGIHNIVRDTISELDEVVDKSTTWEVLKIRVKEFSVKYCKARTSKQAGQIKQLEEKIKKNKIKKYYYSYRAAASPPPAINYNSRPAWRFYHVVIWFRVGCRCNINLQAAKPTHYMMKLLRLQYLELHYNFLSSCNLQQSNCYYCFSH